MQKITKAKRARGIEYLLSKHKALSSNPRTKNKIPTLRMICSMMIFANFPSKHNQYWKIHTIFEKPTKIETKVQV
jgi:hypothetical protein